MHCKRKIWDTIAGNNNPLVVLTDEKGAKQNKADGTLSMALNGEKSFLSGLMKKSKKVSPYQITFVMSTDRCLKRPPARPLRHRLPQPRQSPRRTVLSRSLQQNLLWSTLTLSERTRKSSKRIKGYLRQHQSHRKRQRYCHSPYRQHRKGLGHPSCQQRKVASGSKRGQQSPQPKERNGSHSCKQHKNSPASDAGQRVSCKEKWKTQYLCYMERRRGFRVNAYLVALQKQQLIKGADPFWTAPFIMCNLLFEPRFKSLYVEVQQFWRDQLFQD